MLRLFPLALVILCAVDCDNRAAHGRPSDRVVATQASRLSPPQTSIVVGDILGDSQLVKYVRPQYPDWARKQRLQGTVEFAATIAKDGRPRDLKLVRGPRDLVPYAEDAVPRWRYKPLRLNGTAVEVKTNILVSFTLNQ